MQRCSKIVCQGGNPVHSLMCLDKDCRRDSEHFLSLGPSSDHARFHYQSSYQMFVQSISAILCAIKLQGSLLTLHALLLHHHSMAPNPTCTHYGKGVASPTWALHHVGVNHIWHRQEVMSHFSLREDGSYLIPLLVLQQEPCDLHHTPRLTFSDPLLYTRF